MGQDTVVHAPSLDTGCHFPCDEHRVHGLVRHEHGL